MTLIPLDSILLTDKERLEHLNFRASKLRRERDTMRHHWQRVQVDGQIRSLEKQAADLKAKMKAAAQARPRGEPSEKAERRRIERLFMVEAKKYLAGPLFDEIMRRTRISAEVESRKAG